MDFRNSDSFYAVFYPVALVDDAHCVYKAADSVSMIILKPAFVDRSIRPNLHSFSMLNVGAQQAKDYYERTFTYQ